VDQHYLTPLFQPTSIAVFAGNHEEPATQTPQARAVCEALTGQRFAGNIAFLNIHTSGTLGELAQSRADLAIVALASDEVLQALDVAGRIKCKAALLLGRGVSANTAVEMQQVARRHGMHLLGPNSPGFQRPHTGLNASISGPLAAVGSLALVSQSGALTSSILDWASQNGVGFSAVVSCGPGSAVDITRTLDFLATDARTHSIVVCFEGIGDARRFMSALRAAAKLKPVLVLKAGRKLAGREAAQTHCGANVGNDDVFDAALRRAGAVRVRSFIELFSAAKCLASRYRPVGKRLAVVTNGGGPGVLAADWISEIGLQLGRLSAEGIAKVKPRLSSMASLTDLIDVSEDATAEHYRAAIEAASSEASIDGVLVVYCPQVGIDASSVAEVMAAAKEHMSKPLLSCWMGDASVGKARAKLGAAGIPCFRTPEAAVGAFGNIASFYQNQQLLQQTLPPLSTLAEPDIEGARLIIENVLTERRHVLSELESKALLSAFHIPVTQTILARSDNEAMMIATQLGFPVVLKIDSPDISHKSDVNGVALNVTNAAGVRETYLSMIQSVAKLMPTAKINGVTIQKMAPSKRGREVQIGVVTDDPFGPVIAFGAGGIARELIGDRAIELPPLNQYLARRLIERTRVAETLAEWRGAPAVDLEALENVLLRVSEMVCELPQLREIDINPIIVNESGTVAVDARIVIDNASANARSHAHLAILPYPARNAHVWPLGGGGEYTIRPIHPDDAQMLQALVQNLSPKSRYNRFVSHMTELPASLLARLTLIDYDREMALVAVHRERSAEADGDIIETEHIIGVSRYITNPDNTSCEFSLVVADNFNGRGLGSRLMLSIMQEARSKGLAEIEGLVLTQNSGMLKLMTNLGFQIKPFTEDPDFKLVTYAL
jgi:acetyltransferase